MNKYLTGSFEEHYLKINKVKLRDKNLLQQLNKCKVRIMHGVDLNTYKGEYFWREDALREYSKLKFNENKYYKVWDYTIEDNGWGYCDPDKHPLLYIEPYNGKVYGNEFIQFSEQEREIKLLEKDREDEVDAILTKYNEKIEILRNKFITPQKV